MLAGTIIDAEEPKFAERIDELRTLLGAPHNPLLFPPHFLESTFPRIGGIAAQVHDGDALDGVALLFPRRIVNGEREYTLRYHRTAGALASEEISTVVAQTIGARVVFYDPSTSHTFTTADPADGLVFDRPDEAGAIAIRDLQHAIWQHDSVDSLYPIDVHSQEFRSVLTLHARRGKDTAGFLFGFLKFGGPQLPAALQTAWRNDFRLESQVMGVHPDFRRGDVAFRLKVRQSELAREESIDIVNWTVDPLQYANARLNFDRLGAVAFDFRRNHYAFTNALNIVSASRLAVTWLVNAPRTRSAVAGTRPESDLPASATVLNEREHRLDAEPGQRFAIEVPQDWTALQRADRDLALSWRHTTDDLFEELLGTRQFAITGTARRGDRVFLTGERITDELLATLK